MSLLRDRTSVDAPVTNIELFFDLVYALAITQLTDGLLRDLSPGGELRTLLLLLAVWWAWNYTSWVTNYFDPERLPVRLLLIMLALVSLVMSGSIPNAFASLGLLFATAYVVLQLARTLFAVVALGRGHPLRSVFLRPLFWWSSTGVLWLIGGGLSERSRLAIWGAAVAIDGIGLSTGFPVPGLGRSRTSDYTIIGAHLAERCRLFVLLALGESILVTGANFVHTLSSAASIAGFSVAFLGNVALWWAYFDQGAESGRRAIVAATNPGEVGLWAFTYFHVPIIAGIVVTAAGYERMIDNPRAFGTESMAVLILGGPALFLLGTALYRWSTDRHAPLPRLLALTLLGLLALKSSAFSALGLGVAVLLVIWAVALWDSLGASVALTRRRTVTQARRR